jgi:hypothetical protein
LRRAHAPNELTTGQTEGAGAVEAVYGTVPLDKEHTVKKRKKDKKKA